MLEQASFLDVFQTLVSSGAVIAGGLWGAVKLRKMRQLHPRAEVTHRVSYRPVENGALLLSADVTVKNTGQVLLRMAYWKVDIDQVLPPAGALLKLVGTVQQNPGAVAREVACWHNLLHREGSLNDAFELEPGETDTKPIHCLLPPGIETVMLTSHFSPVANRRNPLTWKREELYDLQLPIEQEVSHVAAEHDPGQPDLLRQDARWRSQGAA